MNKILILTLTLATLLVATSCKEQGANQLEEIPLVAVKTATVSQGDIQNIIGFNGKTVYLKKNTIISPISGYIVKINVNYGDFVHQGDLVFELQTKEKKALGSSDSSLSKLGLIRIMAPSGGIVNDLNVSQPGVFVSEGSPLCTISENKDLVFQLNVPFENNQLVKIGTKCQILLSDKTTLDGVVMKIMPEVNAVSQTQNVLVKSLTSRMLPENLNVNINIKGETHHNCLLVSKKAVLANEVQDEFWVMKISNNRAVKVLVKKGFENDSFVEITSSSLKSGDVIVVEGAYGLSDSTMVKIEK